MSNLFKKLSIAAVVTLGLLIVSVSGVSAQTTTSSTTSTTTTVSVTFTRNLTVGSSGADVSALQSILIEGGYLNISAPTGYFGVMTRAAVAKWQLAAGLPSTGFFGPLSRARLNAVVVYPAGCSSASGFSTVNGASCATTTTTTTTTSYPGGCTSSSGFSTTTGASCATVVSYPAGCSSSAGYSPSTGQKCDSGVVLPAGCTSTVGFSSTTGQSCAVSSNTSTTTTTTTTNTTTTNNGAGSLEDANFISSISNESVGEGEADVKVLGLDLEADNGSDLSLLAVSVELEEQGAGGSDNLDDYASEVSIWLGSAQIGSADVDDFSEDNGVWSRTITLSNASIDAGDMEQLYVAVTALSNIDSADLGSANNDWVAGVSSLRYKDTQGAVITDDSTGDIGVNLDGTNTGAFRDFQFESFASSADVELSLSEDSSNPDAQVVEADESDSTDNVLLLAGNLEAIGSDIHINEMTVTLTPSGSSDADEIASQVILVIDGEEVQSLNMSECSVPTNCDSSADAGVAVTYVFDDVDFDLDEGDEVSVEVRVDVNDIDGSDFVAGSTLRATLDNNLTDAEDQNGDDLVEADLTGSIVGDAQSFFADGIRVTVNSKSTEITENDAANDDNVTFTWNITVSAFGDSDIYVNADAVDVVEDTAGCSSSTTSAANDVDTVYSVETSSGAILTCSGVISDTSDATLVAGAAGFTSTPYNGENFFRVVSGSSESFNITVTGLNSAASKLVRALLTNIEWTADEVSNASATGAATINSYTFDLDNSSPTPWKTIN